MKRNKNLQIRKKTSETDLIVFSIKGYHFALESSAVKEYLTNTKIVPLPRSEKNHLIGLLNIRGEYYSVIDLTLHLDLIENAKTPNFDGENCQKVLVLNPPSQRKDSRVALVIEELTLLFRMPRAKIWTSVPGVVHPQEIQARGKASLNKKSQSSQNLVEKILKGLMHDKKLGLIFYLNDLALHELIDLTEVEKINPISLLETASKKKTKSIDLWRPSTSLKSSKKEQGIEYLIGRMGELIFMLPYDNIQILGHQEEFIILNEKETANLSLPTISGVENYILYDNYLHPLVGTEQLFSFLLKSQNAANNVTESNTDAESRLSKNEMILIATDLENKIRLAITLDEFIDIDKPVQTLPLTHPFVYPHLKKYHPLIEKLAILDQKDPKLQEKVALIVNMGHVLEQVSNEFMTANKDFSWEALQVSIEHIPTLTEKISAGQNVLFLQNLQFESSSTESYITFSYTRTIRLAITTISTKNVHSISEFDLSQLFSKLSSNNVITAKNLKDEEKYILLNPYTEETLSTLIQTNNVNSNQANSVDENWIEALEDNLFSITLDVDHGEDKKEKISILCFNPQPLVTMSVEKILPPDIKEFPPEMSDLPIKGELKSLFRQHEQERTFILNVDKFMTKVLQHTGGAQ